MFNGQIKNKNKTEHLFIYVYLLQLSTIQHAMMRTHDFIGEILDRYI